MTSEPGKFENRKDHRTSFNRGCFSGSAAVSLELGIEVRKSGTEILEVGVQSVALPSYIKLFGIRSDETILQKQEGIADRVVIAQVVEQPFQITLAYTGRQLPLEDDCELVNALWR